MLREPPEVEAPAGSTPMPFLLQPLHMMLCVLSEYVRREQEKQIEYLQVESRILREKIGGSRVLLSDDQRRRLAVKGKALGRRQLGEVAIIAQADTVLRWHRELIEKPEQRSNPRHATGRPRIDQEVVALVLRMARENESWGYKRIQGQLSNVGFRIGKSSVANILKAHGIEPAPTRRQTTSWTTFLKSHFDVFQESILDTLTLWFSKLIRYVLELVSCDNAVVGDAVLENNDAAPSLVILTVPIRQEPASTTQSSRGPPAAVQSTTSHRESRHAA
jgi:transposase